MTPLSLYYIVTAAAFVVFVIAVIVFQRIYISRLVDKKISYYQNDLITKHCDEVNNIYRQMRGWRHDYHNHIQAMKVHLTMNHLEEMERYLNELDHDLTSVDTVIKTGNVMVDAILNSKISLIKSKQININAKASVPENIKISEIDLCVIIGNLLDNAMEACMKSDDKDKRFIRVYIGILKGQLYISVSNSVFGEVSKTGKTYHTTKGENHGFGLMRVDKITGKYNGYVNRQNEDGIFATEIMLPLAG